MLLFVLIVSLLLSQSVRAHESEPCLELSAERINPGGTLEIRGVAFEPEEAITLSLVGADRENTLSEVTTDHEGSFRLLVGLPLDLLEGEYSIRAVAGEHDLLSPPLIVSGIALRSEEDGRREEEESLLAPMPTFPPVAPTAVLSRTALAQVDPSRQASSSNPTGLTIAAVLIVGIVFIVGWKLLPHARES